MDVFMKNYDNRSVTENGAIGYEHTDHALVDLNFRVSSLRNRSEEYITEQFIKAYYESPRYAVKWLFYVRDILEGLGERRTFRVCLKYLAESKPDVAKKILPLIPEYGRFDDLLVLLDTPLYRQVTRYLKGLLIRDLEAMEQGEPISLLAKWLPGINTSSDEKRRLAGKLARGFEMTPRTYRKSLAALRAYGNVAEVKMTASRWEELDYEALPAKANMLYEQAFLRHDRERRIAYVEGVVAGDKKLNSKGIYPYEVVHRMTGKAGYVPTLKDNPMAEALWKKMLNDGFQNQWGLEDCIVVADGSGSMYTPVSGSTSVTALEVCHSLAIYFSQQLQGVFRDKAITFSGKPRFIDLSHGTSLKEKLEIMRAHSEIANTNLEAVFDMLLKAAVSGQVPKEELPKQVLIISDMEFDSAVRPSWGDGKWRAMDEALLDQIERRFRAQGYEMPRLIFWNVCGRTDTIPKVDHESGLSLLSGFSTAAMKVAAPGPKKDPYDSLIEVLDGPRYARVEEALAG